MRWPQFFQVLLLWLSNISVTFYLNLLHTIYFDQTSSPPQFLPDPPSSQSTKLHVLFLSHSHAQKKEKQKHRTREGQLLVRVVQEILKHTAYRCCPCFPSRGRKWVRIAEDTMHSDTGPRGLWAGTDLDASSLRIRFHTTKWCHASFQSREADNNPTQLWCLCTTKTTSKVW